MFFHFIHLVWTGKPIEFHILQRTEPAFAALIRFTELFWYSGWAIVILFAFLYGARWGRGRPVSFRLISLLVLFQLVLNLAYWKFQKLDVFWDVYGFLAVGFLLCRLISDNVRSKNIISAIAVISFLFTFLPLSDVSLFSQNFLGSVLWGGCAKGSSGFPVFPLVGLFVGFYFTGFLYQTGALHFLKSKPKYLEIGFWLVALAFSATLYLKPLAFFKDLYLLGECRFIDLDRTQFWASLIPFIFLLRLSLIEKFNARIAPCLSGLSRLEINRNFAGVYLLTYVLGALLALWLQPLLQKDLFFFFYYCLFLYPMVELLFLMSRRLHKTIR